MAKLKEFFSQSFLAVGETMTGDEIFDVIRVKLEENYKKKIKEATNEELVYVFAECVTEFQIKNWRKLLTFPMTKEDEEQLEEIFFHVGFQVEEEKEITVWMVHSNEFTQMMLQHMNLNFQPFTDEEKVQAMFKTGTEELILKSNKLFRFFEEIIAQQCIQKELFEELPNLLRNIMLEEVN